MHRAGDRVTKDLALPDADTEQVADAHHGSVRAIRGPSDLEIRDEALGVVEKESGRERDDGDEGSRRAGAAAHVDAARAARTAAMSAGMTSNTSPTIP